MSKQYTVLSLVNYVSLAPPEPELKSVINYCTMREEIESLINQLGCFYKGISFSDVINTIRLKLTTKYNSVNGSCNLDYFVWLDGLSSLRYVDGAICNENYDTGKNEKIDKIIDDYIDYFDHYNIDNVDILLIELTVFKREVPLTILDGETFEPLERD